MAPPGGTMRFAILALLSGPASAAGGTSTTKIALLWPETCKDAEEQELCDLAVLSAKAAASDYKNQHQLSWTPEFVQPYSADSGHQRAAHSKSAAAGEQRTHDTFSAMCNVIHTGVNAFVGPLSTEEALVAGRVAGWHHIPLISPSAASSRLSDKHTFPYFRRTHAGVRAQGDAMAEYVLAINWSDVGVFYEDTQEHGSLMAGFCDRFAHYGGKVTYVVSLEAGREKEYYLPALQHVREQYIQVLILMGSAEFAASFIEASLKPEHPPAIFGPGRIFITSEEVADQLVGVRHLWHYSSEWGCINGSSARKDKHLCTCPRCQHHLELLEGLMSITLPENDGNPKMASLANQLGLESPADLNIYERTVYDATWAAMEALDKTGAYAHPYTSAKCSKPSTEPWHYGPAMLKYLDEHPFEGASGHIDFTSIDVHFEYDLLNLQHRDDGADWMKVGNYLPRDKWHAGRRSKALGSAAAPPPASNATHGEDDAAVIKVVVQDGTELALGYCYHCNQVEWPGHGVHPDQNYLLKGMHLHVLTREDHPYLFVNHSRPEHECEVSPAPREGCFWGLLWDIMLSTADHFQFTFDVHIVHGEEQDALDMLAAPHSPYEILLSNLAVTEKRLKYVDFTQPIFESQTVLLTRRATKTEASIFHFLKPFTGNMWLTLFACMVLTGLVYYWLERGVNEAIPEGLAGGEGAMFYSFTAMLFTADGAPCTRGGRLLTMGYYFLALVALSTYTAQLTVFLLQGGVSYDFENFPDFFPSSGSKKMHRLTVTNHSLEHDWVCSQCSCCQKEGAGPSLVSYIPASLGQEEVDAHHQLVHLMEQDCDRLSDDCPLGVILEKHVAEYSVSHSEHCSLSIHPRGGMGVKNQGEVPGLETFGMAMALRKGSPYEREFSEEILHMKEKNLILDLEIKWFTGKCPISNEPVYTNQTTPEKFLGMYIIFLALVFITLVYKHGYRLLGLGVDIDGDGQRDDIVPGRRFSGGGILSPNAQNLEVMRKIEALLEEDNSGTPRSDRGQREKADEQELPPLPGAAPPDLGSVQPLRLVGSNENGNGANGSDPVQPLAD
eukprot:Hpha_TRINITY_DN15275_c2_g1::TRINITY_DN15275_c2_g1_i1::g.64369::m.64369